MTEWLESADLPIQPNDAPDVSVVLAIKAWNMMHGQIDWTALDYVTEIIGITNIECLLEQLEKIREYGAQRNKN
jgi:hypothetical protein